MPILTCEHFDWLINSNNAAITDELERLDDNLSTLRTPVTRDEPEPLPHSPNQLQTPGPNVRDWTRERNTDSTNNNTTATTTDTAVDLLGAAPATPTVPALDPNMIVLAHYNWFMMQSFLSGSVVPALPSPTATPPAPVAAVAVGGGPVVPMMLGDREVHIPKERVLYTQGSHAYFQAANNNNGKGIGRSVCRHWLQKRCTYGEKCAFIHVTHLEPAQQQIFDEFLHKSRSPKK
jgi:hypothetical protein